MARPMKPLVKGGGYYPSRKWTPLVYRGGYTTANGGGEQPDPVEKTVSGAIVHITDALAAPVSALSVAIEPVQNLHGYDNPWPAGGGKQLYNSATYSTVTMGTITCTNNGDGSFTFNADEADTVDRYFDIFNNQFDENFGGTPLPSAEYRLTGTPSGGGESIYTMYVRPSYSNDSGAGITFTNSVIGGSILIKAGYRPQNLVFRPMIRLASVGDDTFAPYSNICPISGRTSATVTRTGKNLFSSEVVHGLWTALGVFYSHDRSSTKYIATKNIIPVVGGETYTLSYINDTNNNIASISYNAYRNGEIIVGGKYITVTNGIINVPSGTDSITLNFILTNNITSISEVTTSSFQLELGSTATDYEPYQGETYSITFPTEAGTVYGGTLDVTGGKMTVNSGFAEFDGSSDENWNKVAASRDYMSIMLSSAINYNISALLPPLTSNLAQALSQDATYKEYTDARVSASVQQKTQLRFLFAGVTDTMTVPEFRQWLQSNPLQVCYELATPFEITLTPTQIDMLLGENNLWADTGDSTLTYYAEGEASTSEALGILLGGTYNNPGGADDASDDEALGILLGGS